jgi:DnaK suppressor protein
MTLDSTTIEKLKQTLLSDKARLEAELSRIGTPTGVPGDYKTTIEDMGTDSDENASEVEEYVDNLGVEKTLETQLKDVTDALKKIEEGTYGVCEKTGESIALDRLLAYPAARTAL